MEMLRTDDKKDGEKTDDEFSAVLITLGRECFELEKKLRAKREGPPRDGGKMREAARRGRKSPPGYARNVRCGVWRIQKTTKNCSALRRENEKKMVTAMLIGGFVGAALIQNYDPTWWKRLRQTLDNWWQPPELSLCDKFARGVMVRSQK